MDHNVEQTPGNCSRPRGFSTVAEYEDFYVVRIVAEHSVTLVAEAILHHVENMVGG